MLGGAETPELWAPRAGLEATIVSADSSRWLLIGRAGGPVVGGAVSLVREPRVRVRIGSGLFSPLEGVARPAVIGKARRAVVSVGLFPGHLHPMRASV